MRAAGTFEVKLAPQSLSHSIEGLPLGRMSLDKTFSGDLEAVSCGEMLSSGNPAQGSAGYVALEWVRGSLHGRSGSFVLQHSATMNRGEAQMSVTVVPDSGAGELSGIRGRLEINIIERRHHYTFDYEIIESA